MTSRNFTRDAALVVPVVLTNAVAVLGQLLWGREHLTSAFTERWQQAGVVLIFALAVESIGVFLAVEAHAARMAGDSSGFLLAGAYAVALLAGGLNFSHWATKNEAAAVTFAVMSALSPWLWSIRSKSMHRAQLRARGLVDPRAVRFSTARKLLYPVRTFRAYRAAVWVGEVDPARAVALLEGSSSVASAGLAPRVEAPAPAPHPSRPDADGAPERVPPTRPAKTATGSGSKSTAKSAKSPASRSGQRAAKSAQVEQLARELADGRNWTWQELQLARGIPESTGRRYLEEAAKLAAEMKAELAGANTTNREAMA